MGRLETLASATLRLLVLGKDSTWGRRLNVCNESGEEAEWPGGLANPRLFLNVSQNELLVTLATKERVFLLNMDEVVFEKCVNDSGVFLSTSPVKTFSEMLARGFRNASVRSKLSMSSTVRESFVHLKFHFS